jgi:hypothetical protein
MAIEIKELIIKASVVSGDSNVAQQGRSQSGQYDIVRKCVDQVMKILERKQER